MVKANVEILQDMRSFLQLCSQRSFIRAFFSVHPQDFTRRRKLPFEQVVALLVNMLKRSLQVELREFFQLQDQCPCSKAAFSEQRQKLQPYFFHWFNQVLIHSFYRHYGKEVQLWKGFKLLACDGSTLYLPQRRELATCFGTQTNQHGAEVMARVLQVEDVLNHLTLYGGLFAIGSSEQSLGYDLCSELPQDSVSVWDRGFASYALMYLLAQQEARFFVIRTKTHHTFKEVEAFLKSPLNTKTTLLYPSDKSLYMLRKRGYEVTCHTPLKVRMVKVPLSSGETEVLLTNLVDEVLYSVEDLKYLYALRWGIETRYFKEKNTLQLEQFSGYSPQAIEQDYLATVLVANLQSLIEKQSQAWLALLSKRRRLSYQINGSAAIATLKHRVVQLLLPRYWLPVLLVQLQTEFERYLEPIRPHRSFARKKKAKRLNGKFQTFNNFKHNI